MKVIDKGNNTSVIITEKNDGFARADAKLIVMVNKLRRTLKNFTSQYHYEVDYTKGEHELLSFNTDDKSKIVEFFRRSGCNVTTN